MLVVKNLAIKALPYLAYLSSISQVEAKKVLANQGIKNMKIKYAIKVCSAFRV
jgi:hypothetical protein